VQQEKYKTKRLHSGLAQPLKKADELKKQKEEEKT